MSHQMIYVPVAGGMLHVGRWGTGARVVVAAHGITANHLSMAGIGEELASDFTVYAPDLRGRGRSNALPGPYGMAAHADDLALVLDHVGASEAIVLGHSMGGFVAVTMAHRHPTKVERLVLVDGGLPLDLGPLADLPVEEITKALIGPALERLRMTFDSPEAYFEFWKPHPALQDNWNERVEAHYRYDLEGNRSSVREEAVLADAGDELTNPDYSQALEALAHPAVLLRAPRGLFNQEPPLYTQAWVAQWPSVESVPVDDVNHYTILFAERGVKAVADIVRR